VRQKVASRKIAISVLGSPDSFVEVDSVVKSLIGFGPYPLNVSRTILGHFRVIGGIPYPSGKLQGFTLLISLHLAPKNINGINSSRLMLGPREPVEFVSEFRSYLNHPRHRSLA